MTIDEPTQRGDDTAAKMRAYFEDHKRDRWQEGTADNLMLGLLNIAVAEYATPQEPGGVHWRCVNCKWVTPMRYTAEPERCGLCSCSQFAEDGVL